MAISTGGGGDEAPMSDINTTPLVDVMLVLLIIFLIAIPVVIQTVEMQLPVVKFEPVKAKKENVLLAVTTTDAAGRDPGAPGYEGANPGGECRVYWNVTPMDSTELVDKAAKHLKTQVELLGGDAAIAAGTILPEDLPEAHIRGDVNTPYRCIGGAVFSMQMAGFIKVGFVSSPIDLSVSAN
ncbi:ExbD/TolR family protein [Sphingorhabdus sp.]|jgi:biopolymer transport protein ExbD|uniref:ExbD/TolR family protein n=1 Tax=Sphingorhabdus sp. TaxID=1902408 RepID=UPI003BB1EE62|nr:biopolymer transporter ExbD [Sphingomonadales bacterium]MBK9432495.1 biopolymer transporter ExbD [Sphingomonadales bacterium]